MDGRLRHHVLVCTHNRGLEVPGGSCGTRGGEKVFKRIRRAVQENDLGSEVLVSRVQCAGPCNLGPIVIVYPEGVWYCRVCAVHGAERIVKEHLIAGRILEELRLPEWVWSDQEHGACDRGAGRVSESQGNRSP